MLGNPFFKRKIQAGNCSTHHGNLAKRFIEGLFAPVGVGFFDYDNTIHELTTYKIS
jgi:hypothetical protein